MKKQPPRKTDFKANVFKFLKNLLFELRLLWYMTKKIMNVLPKNIKKMSPIFPVETKRLDIVKKATKIPYYNSLKPKRNWKECFLKTKAKISNFSWDTFCMLSIKPPWKFEKNPCSKCRNLRKNRYEKKSY